MHLARLLTDTAARVPEKVALVHPASGTTVSFGDFEAEVDRVAAGLQAKGLRRGDRVALAMPNIPQFPFAYFGALRAGGVVIPLNVMLTASEMTKILEDSGARFALAAPPYSDAVQAAAGNVSSVETVFLTTSWDDIGPLGADPTPVELTGDDLAVLAYTSGTTGEPKGAMLSHGNLLANLEQQMAIPDGSVEESDVLMLSLPMFHIFGLNVPLGLLVMNGASGVLIERFEPVEALRLIGKHGITVLFGAPPMYVAWVNTPGVDQYDLASVRLAISGAAALPEKVLTQFRSIFGIDIHEGYGLTETAPTLATNRMAEKPRPGSVGKPLPGVEIRLVDENGDTVELGDPGEIVVRGQNVFKGYWNKPDATEQAFYNGWFRTGDVAVQDEDGYLYLVDRKRDLIIVSGFNVFPSEVEAALLQNPKVSEAAVVGEPHPYSGETVKAFVVLAEGAGATEEELEADIEARLARFKCPSKIEIVPSLPHLPTGKVLKRALRT